MPAKMLLVQNWGKMTHLPQSTTGTSFLLEISYISLFFVIAAPHYHRLYQISSSLEANSSLEDMKQLCGCVDRSHLHTGIIST